MYILKTTTKLVLIDQITKYLMSGFVNIVFIRNVFEFQFWGNSKICLVNIWLLVVLIICLGIVINGFKNCPQIVFGLIFCLSGALSNFMDLILRGFVVDWIRIFSLIFNFADIFIAIGIVMVIKQLIK